MSRKSKKLKKPKAREVSILSADEIESYVRLKFGIDDNGFWNWFLVSAHGAKPIFLV